MYIFSDLVTKPHICIATVQCRLFAKERFESVCKLLLPDLFENVQAEEKFNPPQEDYTRSEGTICL